MKKHLVKIWFDIPGQTNRVYEGFVTGTQRGTKLVIDPFKLFKIAFGYDMPNGTRIISI